MRCYYCFDTIPDRAGRCPHCGSRQPTKEGDAETALNTAEGSAPLTRQQLLTGVVAILIVFGCVASFLAIRVRPEILPAPVIGALGLGTPLPTFTPQVTRGVVVTPTPLTWQEHTNRRAGFNMSFPQNWLIVDQSQFGWQEDVRDLSEEYSWAETLFESGSSPSGLQSRAIDPNATDLAAPQLVIFTVGQTAVLTETLDYNDIAALVRSNPAVLAELAGPLIGTDFATRRTENTTINGLAALLVEFTANTEILDSPVRLQVRLYFVNVDDELYLISYFAEEQQANDNRFLYEEIVQTFALN